MLLPVRFSFLMAASPAVHNPMLAGPSQVLLTAYMQHYSHQAIPNTCIVDSQIRKELVPKLESLNVS